MLKNVKELEIIARDGGNAYKLVAVSGGFNLISQADGHNWGFRSIENCTQWILGGTWIIKEFNFHVDNWDKEFYKATYLPAELHYQVTWDFDSNGKKGTNYLVDVTKDLLRRAAWVIVEPKPVEVVSPVKGIKIGDKVIIRDVGAQYTTYSEWAARNSVSGFEYGARATEGVTGIVVAQAIHSATEYGENRFIIAVQVESGQTFLIEERGVEAYVAPVPNGFDAEGKPLNYEEANLQLYQRVQLRSGDIYIVMPNIQTDRTEQFALVRVAGWTTWAKNEECPQFDPVAVFAAPDYNHDLLDVREKGKLLWVSKDNEAYQRKMRLQADIAEARSNLNNLEEELESLA